MVDPLLSWLLQSLPEEIARLAEPYIAKLDNGHYQALLQDEESLLILGHNQNFELEAVRLQDFPTWRDFIFHRLGLSLADRSRKEKQIVVFCIGYAALLAFLQANVTGPPLPFSSAELLFPHDVAHDKQAIKATRAALLESLGVDGISAYKLTPNIELLCLADAIMTCPPILKNVRAARWAKMRVAFMRQRLLSEVSSTLQDVIYDDLGLLEDEGVLSRGEAGQDVNIGFLLERATVHTHHGLDKLARKDLDDAKAKRHFEFALTGLLGKRTKFQEKDVSQLVVLARSSGDRGTTRDDERNAGHIDLGSAPPTTNIDPEPVKLDLNDDTLLESISFSEKPTESLAVKDSEALPPSLASLDPSNQPQLDAIDSTILLSFASSITNTSPQHGLTREETLPYATRVLEGGSSNWQVYTQALLVRSRIEGYKSRTIERGLLQLQALVDQVIADTASTEAAPAISKPDELTVTSFLPRSKESESAPVTERLRYIFSLASPTRWDLEAELASRWVQLGGLRSALEIYERLEMWAEAALCWAATEREDKAKRIVRRQLFHASHGTPATPEHDIDDDTEMWQGPERVPPPLDAPRLYCILGDIEQSPAMYEKAWEVSKQRYARAQRSLGRFYIAAKDFLKAAEAYSKSLRVNQLNHASWFALGCALLELAQYAKAVEAFSRCVQLDDTDAEAWSNLGAALLRTDPTENADTNGTTALTGVGNTVEEDGTSEATPDSQRIRQDALHALKRAASLKHDSFRIWENVLIVAASLTPPDFTACLSAQKRIVDIRAATDGERCIDIEILELVAQHIISSTHQYEPPQPGLPRMFVKFMDESVVPLITGSTRLWQLVGRLALWRNKPSTALDAEEKAWRAVTSQPGWETESEKRWDEVVEATVRLCDSYESLGPKERTEGMGAGEQVAKDWKFKARSAVRGILGRGKGSWEGTAGWDQLQETMQGFRG